MEPNQPMQDSQVIASERIRVAVKMQKNDFMLISFHLRRHVVGGAAEGVGHPVQVDLQLAHPEVGEPDVTLVIEENVVQL